MSIPYLGSLSLILLPVFQFTFHHLYHSYSHSCDFCIDSMPTSIASAPGKVILFGEHAVVYGVTAIAAALSDLRIIVQVVKYAIDIVKPYLYRILGYYC